MHAGDTIRLKVNARYETVPSQVQGLEGVATEIAGAVSRSAAGLENAGAATGSNGLAAGSALATGKEQEVPQAYLNYLLYDENYQLVDQGFQQVSEAAAVGKANPSAAPEALELEVPIREEGFLYTYLSNEPGASSSLVYFDDFTVEQQSYIVQVDDYYPFGASFDQSAGRVLKNKYLYNGKELQSELEWLDYGFRMYDPSIARWHVQDAHSGKYPSWSPYNYVMNNPILLIDFMGLDPIYRDGKYYETDDGGKEYEVDFDYVQGWLQSNDHISASYGFESTGSGTAITETKEGKTNTFAYNGQSFTANSMATLMGRDDRDNAIGAFSGIESISGLELENLLGHATSVFYDMYNGNVEQAVFEQSIGGILDYKNTLYRILGFDRNSLIEINGVTYNANEAGNFVWGMVIEYAGGLISPNMIAELGTRFAQGRSDESWEQKAISAGRDYGIELLKRDEKFKRQIIFQRVQFRTGAKDY